MTFFRMPPKISKKHASFVSSPNCWQSDVATLPGIGLKAAEKLKQNDVKTASEVVDKYLQFERDHTQLIDWLKSYLTSKGAKECSACISEWTTKYIGK